MGKHNVYANKAQRRLLPGFEGEMAKTAVMKAAAKKAASKKTAALKSVPSKTERVVKERDRVKKLAMKTKAGNFAKANRDMSSAKKAAHNEIKPTSRKHGDVIST